MTYTVKRGDTLSAIAQKHGTTVAALVAANGIPSPNLIRAGEVLEIPVKETQTVAPSNNQLYNAFKTCLDAIEELPEFKQLEKMLYG